MAIVWGVTTRMHFMIDFENTKSSGLVGGEYITRDDAVTIFFSQSAQKVERGKMQTILESGCDFSICKLANTGKNALDFYIASRIGEIFGGGYDGVVGIISKDQGFNAVAEYWRGRSKVKQLVYIRPNIELCIRATGDNSPRFRRIQEDLQEVSIEGEWQKYTTRNKLRMALADALAAQASDDPELIDRVMRIVESGGKRSGRLVYLDMLKEFGRKRGLEIYGGVKKVI